MKATSGISLAGFSCLTNWTAGLNYAPLSHAEVLTAGNAASEIFGSFLATALSDS
ncbi:MAG: hypothetical protein ABI787_06925 [Spartobacteria bacterium]